MLEALLLTGFTGILGTSLGGLLGIIIHKRFSKAITYLLALSAGMMISMVCFDLLPEALEMGGVFISVGGCALGIFLLLILDGKFHHHNHEHEIENNLHHHDLHPNDKMIQLGFMMIISVSLHNFPEGMAIGSSTLHHIHTGFMMSILLALHNLPEGMGMIAPLIEAGISKSKALFLVSLSGSTTLLGGFVGVLIGTISEEIIAFTLAFAAGCMLYVTIYEMLPQIKFAGNKKVSLLFLISGFLFGFMIIQIL